MRGRDTYERIRPFEALVDTTSRVSYFLRKCGKGGFARGANAMKITTVRRVGLGQCG